MRSLLILALAAFTPSKALAGVLQPQVPLAAEPIDNETAECLIEIGPGETRWVSEDEKWALKRDGVNFIDITTEHEKGVSPAAYQSDVVQYPTELKHEKTIKPLFEKLSKQNMLDHLIEFTSFRTRYYKSQTGVESATWLYEQIQKSIVNLGATYHGVRVEKFEHPWGQFSIIATIPGKTNNTIAIGAHQDSINLLLPSILPAPGADDDGSGTVTILEAFRVLLQTDIRYGNATNTVEFHWYSAEEGGLLGSQAIFSKYKNDGRVVKAMLQQDMTGYVQGTFDAGKEESVGVVTDFVDKGLTEFIKSVIQTYCDIPYVLTKCGYACSDHASASRYGYPSAFVIESDFALSNQKIHTTQDKIEYLSFDHMLQHAKMTLSLAYELAYAEL